MSEIFNKNVIIILLLSFTSSPIFSQDSLHYGVDVFGSVATESITPFGIVNNTYGLVPLQANNGYLRGSASWDHKFNKNFTSVVCADLVGAVNHSSSFFIQQLYGEIGFQSLRLTLGQKEYYNSMLDKELSSGDFNFSTNARPIPEINLGIPEFVNVPFTKGILQIRGDFAVGKSMDNDYTLKTVNPGEDYALNVLWHHKSLFFLIRDPNKKIPLSLTLGLEHAVQWGGWSSIDRIGDIPHSFEDFIRVVLGEGGGDDSTIGDQLNALGNHQGTYNFKLTYDMNALDISVYKQHFFDDNSGLEYANWRDGIWGVECAFRNQPYLKKFVAEYINTTDQSGPMHFLWSDRENVPVRGGGNDDYYNHEYYMSGWSHWGRSLGNALLTSPEYNGDGALCFKNNRIKAFHIGFSGNVNKSLDYRIIAAMTEAWGRMSFPFLEKKNNNSFMLECGYKVSRFQGWKISGQFAVDHGSLYGNNLGCSFKISKSGDLVF